MKKRYDETVIQFSRRLKENVRMFAELPHDTEEIPEAEKEFGCGNQVKQGKNSRGKSQDKEAKSVKVKPDRRQEDKKYKDSASAQPKEGMWCLIHKTASHNTSDGYTIKRKGKDELKATDAPYGRARARKKQYPRIHQDSESDSDTGCEEFAGSASSSDDNELKFVGLVGKKGSEPANAPLRIPVKFRHGGKTVEALLVVAPPTPEDAMVIGRDIMGVLGLIINFKAKIMQWEDSTSKLNTGHHIAVDDDEVADETKEAAAKAVQPEQLLTKHLEGELAQQYLELLAKYQALYDGHLGRMNLADYKIPIAPDFKPIHAKPYPVARSQEEKARKEIQRLINADVLEQIYDSEIASPAFFLTKPSGDLRLLNDFREHNKFLRRSPYYVPRIREILMRLSQAKCVSTFDANLGYYGRRLDKKNRSLTAFCLPFGKFRYKRLPMGISTAPDEYQACMKKIVGDLDFVMVYVAVLHIRATSTLVQHALMDTFRWATCSVVTIHSRKHYYWQKATYICQLGACIRTEILPTSGWQILSL
ncbi:unnamed protein product [Phytophthora fragariaefolia]|uniref:Unnamed protein product n=1 Tax=Phytophthora fragariaefolia TaxID=1490495 RepID=A0A9W7CSI3_9STRA|nr:unnamed protein product [Phytophthora fragariaefolia]